VNTTPGSPAESGSPTFCDSVARKLAGVATPPVPVALSQPRASCQRRGRGRTEGRHQPEIQIHSWQMRPTRIACTDPEDTRGTRPATSARPRLAGAQNAQSGHLLRDRPRAGGPPITAVRDRSSGYGRLCVEEPSTRTWSVPASGPGARAPQSRSAPGGSPPPGNKTLAGGRRTLTAAWTTAPSRSSSCG
jgi:hypothetical protein